jgi:hypothetical protein
MKQNMIPRLLAAAGLLSVASAKIQAEVRYSDSMVDVGNLDLFAQTWQKIYAASGNAQSVLTDVTSSTYNTGCNSWADDANTNAKVTINGQWGKIPGLGPHDSREALVQSIWAALKAVSDENSYDVFNECYGLTWQEGVPNWAGAGGSAACGGAVNTVATDCPCDIGTAACHDHSLGHKVPSLIKANLYDADGALLADNLEITFESAAVGGSGGCSTVTKVAAALIGLIPGSGSLFSTGINVACLELA